MPRRGRSRTARTTSTFAVAANDPCGFPHPAGMRVSAGINRVLPTVTGPFTNGPYSRPHIPAAGRHQGWCDWGGVRMWGRVSDPPAGGDNAGPCFDRERITIQRAKHASPLPSTTPPPARSVCEPTPTGGPPHVPHRGRTRRSASTPQPAPLPRGARRRVPLREMSYRCPAPTARLATTTIRMPRRGRSRTARTTSTFTVAANDPCVFPHPANTRYPQASTVSRIPSPGRSRTAPTADRTPPPWRTRRRAPTRKTPPSPVDRRRQHSHNAGR